MKAAIVGIAGPALADAEAALFRAQPPAGVILFARNIVDPPQLRALTAALREAMPPPAVLMIDQEGGRVARLRAPHWRTHPPAAGIGRTYAMNPVVGLRLAWLTGALIGLDCAGEGFDVVCAPVLDLKLAGADDAIGDRAFAADPEAVGRLGRTLADGMLAAGVQPVGKHAPGHGRARVDSHAALPVVEDEDLATDLLPFACNAELPWLMTAHIRYPVWDADNPATLSPRIIADIIRGRIGFEGVLLSDDLAMGALTGTPPERALRALAAGCDLALYCPGDPTGTAAVLEACPPVAPAGIRRLAAARGLASERRLGLDPAAHHAERERLMSRRA